MPRVLVSDTLSEAGLALLRANPDLVVEYAPGLKEPDLVAKIVDFDALVIRSGSKVTKKVIEAAQKLRVIGRAGIGVDNVDVYAASKRGILVMNTPTGNSVTTAEHAITLIMSLARKVPQATASMKAGKWEKTKFQGRELTDKTLGVLGLGTIGRIVADRARGLHMKVIAYDPVLTPDRASSLGVQLVPLPELFARADVITAHTPLTAETRGIVNDAAIEKMKKGVLLVNCARGGVYDEAALGRGLESGKIGGVALDVFLQEPAPADHPLFKFDNVILTPHLGASTEEAQERVALEVVEQVVNYLATGTIVNAVNAPSVPQEIAPKLGPYLDLARRLGAFLGQVEGIAPRAIEVECVGEPAELGAKAITRAALAGLLERFFDEPVNAVSAPVLAEERGIVVREVRTERRGKFANLVALRATEESGKLVVAEGALASDGSARLTRWGDYELDAELFGHTLVLFNEDTPGVIGAVGTILGRENVNVAQVNLGRQKGTRQSVSVWNCDAALSEGVLDEIKKLPNVARVASISLK